MTQPVNCISPPETRKEKYQLWCVLTYFYKRVNKQKSQVSIAAGHAVAGMKRPKILNGKRIR